MPAPAPRSTILRCGVALLTLVMIPQAFARPAAGVGEDTLPAAKSRNAWNFGINGEAGYLVGDEFDKMWATAGVSAKKRMNEDVDLAFGFRYIYDDYDFETNELPVLDEPWEEVHTFQFSARASFRLDNNWSIFGGPVLQFSGEADADFDDGFTGGGAIGLTYRADQDLTIGGGVLLMSQIEDSARVFPIIVIDWKITEDLRLTNRSGLDGAGLELIFDLDRHTELAVGMGFEFKRFALENDGAGQDTGLPIRFRYTRAFTPAFSFTAFVGAKVNGEIELRTDTARFDKDTDEAFIFGIGGSYRF